MCVARVAYCAVALLSFLLSAQSVHAFGISPPEFVVEAVLTSTSSVTETVRLQRGAGEVGALTFETSIHGDCDGCITGATGITMPADADVVEYTFIIAPGGAAGGKHEQRVAFYLTSATSDGSGATVSIRRGVTAVAWFTVATTAASSSSNGSSGSGGGSGGGSSTTDTSTTDDSASTPLSSGEALATDTTSEAEDAPTSSVETESVGADTSESQEYAPTSSESASSSVATTDGTGDAVERLQITSDYDITSEKDVQIMIGNEVQETEYVYKISESMRRWLSIILTLLLVFAMAAWGVATALRPNTLL